MNRIVALAIIFLTFSCEKNLKNSVDARNGNTLVEVFHYGNDVSSDGNDRSVRAADDGIVIENKFYDKATNSNDFHPDGWKYTILLEHYDESGKPIYRSRYANLYQKPDLKPGQKVKEGSIIGVIGPAKDQNSFLHFEIQKYNSEKSWEYVNPTNLNIGKYEKLSDIPEENKKVSEKSKSQSTDITDIKVDFALAEMVEEVVRKTNFKINISKITKKTVNIDKIDSINVCDSKVKKKVLELQKAFNEHPNIYKSISLYGAWIKQNNGNLTKVKNHSVEYDNLTDYCHNMYLSVI